jgi:hypothetical protein
MCTPNRVYVPTCAFWPPLFTIAIVLYAAEQDIG